MGRAVLVVAAHADDEALGCGGAIARHVAAGDDVHLVLMADGVNSRLGADTKDLDNRVKAASKAQRILGVAQTHMLGLRDNAMDSVPLLQIVQTLEPHIQRVAPEIVYTHHHGDLNVDHRLTQKAVMTACRPQPGSPIREIYGFEVLSSTEWATPNVEPFVPCCFVDITDQLPAKLEALEAYADEMRPTPHSRSLEHAAVLARHRGYSIGVEAAEAFVVYRIIR